MGEGQIIADSDVGGYETDLPIPDAPAPSGGPALSIVIPAFNEERRLPESLERLIDFLLIGDTSAEQVEVLVVDDGSSDRTARIAREVLRPLPLAQVLSLPANRGKGAAVRTGVANAKGAVIAFLDADMAVDPADLPSLLRQLDTAEVAIGSRALASSFVDCRSVRRTLLGRAFNRIATTVTELELRDTQCGFKAFRTPVARLLFHFASVDRFAFDVEILALAQSLGMRIGEVPVSWKHVPGSHIRPWLDPLSMLADLTRTRVGLLDRRPLPAVLAVAPSAGRTGPPMPGRPSRTVAVELSSAVRRSDAVLPWGHGAAVLLPLSGPEEQQSVLVSLAERMPGWRFRPTELAFEQILAASPLAAALVPNLTTWAPACLPSPEPTITPALEPGIFAHVADQLQGLPKMAAFVRAGT
ncbi:MAG: dolichyl-phosphate beta-glucosyltransferase [Acidimicrobiales bacterium]